MSYRKDSTTPRRNLVVRVAGATNAAVCLLVYLALAGSAAAQPPAAPVITADVVRDEIQARLRFSGTLISRFEAELSAETEGRVIKLARVGERFVKGDVIAHLDDTLLQKTLAENQAGARSQIARIKFLENEVARLSKLAETNHATVSLLEKTQSDLDVARSDLAAARARIALTEERIQRMGIAAPFDGVITALHTEIGEWVSEGGSVAELVNTDSLEVQTYVSADILPYIKVGDRIDVMVEGRFHQTELRTIVPVGDKASRLFELRLIPDGVIGQPGLPVDVWVPAAAPRDGLLIPEDALVIRHNGISVFRVEKDMTAARVPVRPGLSTGDGRIEIDGPLKTGDKVVVRGGERLRDGLTVRIAPPHNGNRRKQ